MHCCKGAVSLVETEKRKGKEEKIGKGAKAKCAVVRGVESWSRRMTEVVKGLE